MELEIRFVSCELSAVAGTSELHVGRKFSIKDSSYLGKYRHMTAMDIYPTTLLHLPLTYYELTFKLQHDCPYNDFSKTYPATAISHWCNWSRDVLEISYGEIQNRAIQHAISSMLKATGSKVIRTSRIGADLRVVLQHCACDKLPPPTLPTIERRNCLNLQPMLYTGGWEWYRVAAFSERDLRNLFKDLENRCTVEVTSRRSVVENSVHDSSLVSTRSLLGGLTKKQAWALTAALDHGYFDFPRDATAVELAKRLGVPRTSYVDHLRKAQNKVIRAVGPYIRLQTSGGEPHAVGLTDR